MLTPIIAAGGIVVNPNKEILWIFRRGFWDLPKGKLDPNETIEACALREVMEETGVSNLVLGDLIMTTTHLYHDMYLNTEVEKTTYWYLMTTDQLQDGIPQTEEDIEAIAWVKKADLAPYLSKTYDTIKKVMEDLRELWEYDQFVVSEVEKNTIVLSDISGSASRSISLPRPISEELKVLFQNFACGREVHPSSKRTSERMTRKT